MNLRDLIERERQDLKLRDPDRYAKYKQRLHWGLVGAFTAAVVIAVLYAVTAWSAVACSSVTITPTGLSCEPTTAPPVTPPVTPPPVTPPPVTPPPTDPYAACPAGTVIGGDVWGLSNIETSTAGAWGDGQILVYRIIPTAAMSSVRNSTWAAYAGGGGARQFAVTTKACDFSGATTIAGSYGGKAEGLSTGPQFYYRAGATVGGAITMKVGEVYYLNFRNPLGSCPSGNCVMRGSVPK